MNQGVQRLGIYKVFIRNSEMTSIMYMYLFLNNYIVGIGSLKSQKHVSVVLCLGNLVNPAWCCWWRAFQPRETQTNSNGFSQPRKTQSANQLVICSLPETNIAPENRPSMAIPQGNDRIQTINFQGLCLLVSGSVVNWTCELIIGKMLGAP